MNCLKLAVLMTGLSFAVVLSCPEAHAVRKGPVGTKSGTYGPEGQIQAQGTRSVKGPQAESNYSVQGRKRGVTGNASSTVGGGKATGTATFTTNKGRSATAQGQGSVSAGKANGSGSITTKKGMGVNASGSGEKTATGVSGSGTIQTNSGRRGATGSGSAQKTDTGISGSGTVETNKGKTASGTIDGNKQSGTVSVTTDRGTRSHDYSTGSSTSQKIRPGAASSASGNQ